MCSINDLLPSSTAPWPPNALPSGSNSSGTSAGERSATATLPRPSGPSTPMPCASSTYSRASWLRATSASSRSGATSPSMLKTPSVASMAAPFARAHQLAHRRLGVAVRIALEFAHRQARAVEQAGVVELVLHADIARPEQRLHHRQVGQVAAAEQQRARVAQPLGGFQFEGRMFRAVAADQRRRAAADAMRALACWKAATTSRCCDRPR